MSNRPVVLRFVAPVTESSVNSLLSAVDRKLKQGAKHFLLLISSPGGSVFYGLTAYNYLKGIPAAVHTHNIGSVDSIGVVLYCAGRHRLSVPNARFLLHGVKASFQNERLGEHELEERLKAMRLDTENIARVIAETTDNPMKEVLRLMKASTTMNASEARHFGLVHEIRPELFEPGSEIISVS